MADISNNITLPLPPSVAGLSAELRTCVNLEPDFLLWQAADDDAWWQLLENTKWVFPKEYVDGVKGYRNASLIDFISDHEQLQLNEKAKADWTLVDSVSKRLLEVNENFTVGTGLGAVLTIAYALGDSLRYDQSRKSRSIRMNDVLKHFAEKRGADIFWAGEADALHMLLVFRAEAALFDLWKVKSALCSDQPGKARVTEAFGRGLLHLSLQYRLPVLAKNLLEAGVDPNALDSSGRYPWFKCFEPSNWQLLKSYGADFSLVDSHGGTVFQVYSQMSPDAQREMNPLIAAITKNQPHGVDGLTIWRSANTLGGMTTLLKGQKIHRQQAEVALLLTTAWGRYEASKDASVSVKLNGKHRGDWFNEHIHKFIEAIESSLKSSLSPLSFKTAVGPFQFVALTSFVVSAMKSKTAWELGKRGNDFDLAAFVRKTKDKESVWRNFPEWFLKEYQDKNSKLWDFVENNLLPSEKNAEPYYKKDILAYRNDALHDWQKWGLLKKEPNAVIEKAFKVIERGEEYDFENRKKHQDVAVLAPQHAVVEQYLTDVFFKSLVGFAWDIAVANTQNSDIDWSTWGPVFEAVNKEVPVLRLTAGVRASNGWQNFIDHERLSASIKSFESNTWWRGCINSSLERFYWSASNVSGEQIVYLADGLLSLKDLIVESRSQGVGSKAAVACLSAFEQPEIKTLMTKVELLVPTLVSSLPRLSSSLWSEAQIARNRVSLRKADSVGEYLSSALVELKDEFLQLDFRAQSARLALTPEANKSGPRARL